MPLATTAKAGLAYSAGCRLTPSVAKLSTRAKLSTSDKLSTHRVPHVSCFRDVGNLFLTGEPELSVVRDYPADRRGESEIRPTPFLRRSRQRVPHPRVLCEGGNLGAFLCSA